MLSDRFRAAIEAVETASATELFHEDAVFRSPVVYRPYAGRDAVLKVLEAAERVLGLGGHFRYVHQVEDTDARVAFLEFATEVDGRQVEGIDKLTFDQDGRITELKVMLRPASALQVVGAHGRRIHPPRARHRLKGCPVPPLPVCHACRPTQPFHTSIEASRSLFTGRPEPTR